MIGRVILTAFVALAIAWTVPPVRDAMIGKFNSATCALVEATGEICITSVSR